MYSITALVGFHPEEFRRSGVVFFAKKTRTLRGQKGMVDAGESPLLQNIRKSSSLWHP